MIYILPVDRSVRYYHQLVTELDKIGAGHLMPVVAEYALERAVAGPPPAYVQAEEDLYELLNDAIEDHLGIPQCMEITDNDSLELSNLLSRYVGIINSMAEPMMGEWARWAPELKTYDQHHFMIEKITHQGLFLRIEN